MNSQKTNCIDHKANAENFKVNSKTSLESDPCYEHTTDNQNCMAVDYMLSNFYHCDCDMVPVKATALKQPEMQFRDGYGSVGQRGCLVDNDSTFKNGGKLTNGRGRQQLKEPFSLSTPYMGRGLGDICAERNILEGEGTSIKRASNTLAGITIDNQFTPLLDSVANNIQNPKHLVEETVKDDWIRGGIPTRKRNEKYRC